LVSGGEKGNKNSQEYGYNHIAIAIPPKGEEKRKKKSNVYHLYVPDHFHHILYRLEEILDREGTSVSKWFREQAETYVNVHWPGNPQTPITKYVGEPQKPDPYGCGNFLGKHKGRVRCRLTKQLMHQNYCLRTCKYGPQEKHRP